MSAYYCPACGSEVCARRNRTNGRNFLACSRRDACGFTWNADPERRPALSSVWDGQRIPRLLAGYRDTALARLDRLAGTTTPAERLEFAGQILDAEELFALGAVHHEIAELERRRTAT